MATAAKWQEEQHKKLEWKQKKIQEEMMKKKKKQVNEKSVLNYKGDHIQWPQQQQQQLIK